MALNFAEIRKQVPILKLASHLGIEVHHNRSRCIFPARHKNQDRTPSLSFNPKTNSFKCWVCEEVRGSVLDLVMLVSGLNLMGAVNYLRDAGFVNTEIVETQAKSRGRIHEPSSKVVGPNVESLTSSISRDRPKSISDAKRILIYNEFFRRCDGVSSECMNYLKGRRIYRKTANMMGLASIKNYSETQKCLEAAFDLESLQLAGLYNAKGHLRFYKHPLLIPYFLNGQILFFQARAIDTAVTPKELNPTGPIRLPYNIDNVRNAPVVYLCEGVIDTLTLVEQGFPAVGVPGAGNFKKEWVSYFEGKRIFSVFDGDSAGRSGNERIKEMMAQHNIPFSVIPIPNGKDINDLFTRRR